MTDVFDTLDIDLDNVQLEQADEQPKTRRPRSDKGQPRRTSNKKLADDLLNPWAKLVKTLAFGAPTVAAVLARRGEKTVDAIVSIAAEHPRMLAALKKVSKIGPATDLMETGIMIVVAAALDFGRIPPTHPAAMLSGVAELWDQVHEPIDPQTNGFTPPPGEGFAMSVPPGFNGFPPGFN